MNNKLKILVLTLLLNLVILGCAKKPIPNTASTNYYSNNDSSGIKNITFSNGDQYKGEWRFGKPHGKGVYYFRNSDTYDGTFINGKYGYGVFKTKSSTYSGPFENDLYSGWGALIFTDGSEYRGNFKAGKKNGDGTFITKVRGLTYTTYSGNFVDDSMSGKGTMRYKDNSKYIGNWKDNLKHGYGTLYLPNGEIDKDGLWSNDSIIKSNLPEAPKGKESKSLTTQYIKPEFTKRCKDLGFSEGTDRYNLCIKSLNKNK